MPLLDWRVVCYAFSVPDESKVGRGYSKRLLREAMRGVVPEPCALAPRQARLQRAGGALAGSVHCDSGSGAN